MSLDNVLVLSRPFYIKDRDCGYCHGNKKDHYALESMIDRGAQNGSVTIGSSVEQMTCKQYDEFINQGFRRSGTFMYKNDILRSCCRLYTIRTQLSNFKLDKKQRKIVNRFVKKIYEPTKHDNKTFDIYQILQAQQKSKSFYTRYEPSVFSREKFQLYKKYQMAVHNDKDEDVTESSFKRFLCDTPFPRSEVDGTNRQWNDLNSWIENWSQEKSPHTLKNRRIGPVHECWYLHDKLIAVSIMDFLPTGVSSIYFIWDPDYADLSLGTVSGIREILMCNELNLGYYYLGYYIEDCQKMKYKAKFGGEILDLCNEVYFPLDVVKPYIANGRFFVMDEDESESEQSDKSFDELYQELEMENNGHPMSYEDSSFNGKPLRNVAEQIYGAYSPTFKVQAKLEQLTKSIPGMNEESDLPGVIPGVIPLWQIVEWFENGTIDKDIPISMFDCVKYEMVECSFAEASSHQKRIYIDCIRLFGLDKVQDATILIN